jgi:hypothetical protein
MGTLPFLQLVRFLKFLLSDILFLVHCDPLIKARHAQEAGAVALVIFNEIRYWLASGLAVPGGRDVIIPVLDMSPHQYVQGTDDIKVEKYMTKNPSVTAEVTIIPRT